MWGGLDVINSALESSTPVSRQCQAKPRALVCRVGVAANSFEIVSPFRASSHGLLVSLGQPRPRSSCIGGGDLLDMISPGAHPSHHSSPDGAAGPGRWLADDDDLGRLRRRPRRIRPSPPKRHTLAGAIIRLVSQPSGAALARCSAEANVLRSMSHRHVLLSNVGQVVVLSRPWPRSDLLLGR